MTHILDLPHGSLVRANARFHSLTKYSVILPQYQSLLHRGKHATSQQCQASSTKRVDYVELHSSPDKVKIQGEANFNILPCVQTLRDFPEDLSAKIVMVRIEIDVLLRAKQDQNTSAASCKLSTIRYLYRSDAKIILLGNWSVTFDSEVPTVEFVAEYLSFLLQFKVLPVKLVPDNMQPHMEHNKESVLLLDNLSLFKEERANCSKFSNYLSLGVDIFVNDAFSQCHRILASTVGVANFCCSCIAGFHFEADLCKLKEAFSCSKKPYVAIIGGGNLFEKAAALKSVASFCDGLVFVGNMAFQLMNALGMPVPMKLVEKRAVREALGIIQYTKARSISLLLPKDFWCRNDNSQMEIFSADCIPDSWSPVDVGPNSMEEITSLLSMCKKIFWIGPVQFDPSCQNTSGTYDFAQMLDTRSRENCDITVAGDVACKAVMVASQSQPACYLIESPSVIWEYLRGRNLPGVMALDRAYPFKIEWDTMYKDPALPLLVDIGSGNGLFIFRMAPRRKDLNYLGLDINKKLVDRCVNTVHQSGIRNVNFLATNATSTFRSIVSSYPGELVLVSIQCPIPDFRRPEHRWQLLQRSLVEAIVDLLAYDGKVFLQSDIKEVVLRMKEQFAVHGKGKLHVENGVEWLEENPFGVRSDWEDHVLDRGALMYRLLLSKPSFKN
ncbi:uncharacterized protein LOC141709045 isoform X1 [Apium graveolens]|uniref:uncharacterized protein LOC141709045 isoform X1 n=1 Tax=Apium graveolens TaxID=4045 RepID=UPI003D7A97D2